MQAHFTACRVQRLVNESNTPTEIMERKKINSWNVRPQKALQIDQNPQTRDFALYFTLCFGRMDALEHGEFSSW